MVHASLAANALCSLSRLDEPFSSRKTKSGSLNEPRNRAAATRAATLYVLNNRMLTKKELRNIPVINPSKAYR